MLRQLIGGAVAPAAVWALAAPDAPERAHGLLRALLAERIGVPPDELRFGREPCPLCGGEDHGRPVLADPGPGLEFSLSRAAGLALVALAPTPVGVDVEALPDPGTVDDVAPLLHPAEQARIADARLAARPAAFARAWTRKEAYLKALGSGIAADLVLTRPGCRAAGLHRRRAAGRRRARGRAGRPGATAETASPLRNAANAGLRV